jgi:integral membrane protein (TIGR01906 family)
VIALLIISLGVVLILYFRPLYYLDISLLHLDTASGLDAAYVRRNYDALCSYLFVWNRAPLTLPDFAMSEHGRIHFADCKRIFDVVQAVCLVTGILTLIGALRRKHTSRCLYIAGSLTILIPLVLGLLAVFQWNTVFTVFHTILFRNNYWLFDPRTDPVILILPDSFFFQCAVGILVIVLAGGIICLVSARRKR